MDKPKLLLVEDDLDLCEMVSTYFRVQNYDVVTAAFADEGYEAAQEQQLDLIMLDIRLPDMDGFDLCRKLRQTRKTADTPIIFLTEKRDRLDKLQGLELGVVDYITKPFDIQELRLRVRNAINRSKTPSSANPITELPEGTLVNEKVMETLKQENWTLLVFAIEGLAAFRGRYGFVAADDVLRAVTLMIRNAVREFGNEHDFIGHLRSDRFVIITASENANAIEQRISRRINQSSSYFYPLRDQERAQAAQAANLLHVESAVITQADGPFSDIDALDAYLAARIHGATQPSDIYFTETRPPAMPISDPAEPVADAEKIQSSADTLETTAAKVEPVTGPSSGSTESASATIPDETSDTDNDSIDETQPSQIEDKSESQAKPLDETAPSSHQVDGPSADETQPTRAEQAQNTEVASEVKPDDKT